MIVRHGPSFLQSSKRNHMRYSGTFACIVIAFSFLAADNIWSPVANAADRPNVVMILVDDLGWNDLSCQGSDVLQTPNIDRLAKHGTRFTNAYAAAPVCSPTRAAIITGQSPARTGVTDWIRARHQRDNDETATENPTTYVVNRNRKLQCPANAYFLPKNHVTIAERLKSKGYKTCFIGKWHLGDPGWYPTDQGFDVNVGGCDISRPPGYFDPYTNTKFDFDGTLEPDTDCLLYTSPSPRDQRGSRMPSSA